MLGGSSAPAQLSAFCQYQRPGSLPFHRLACWKTPPFPLGEGPVVWADLRTITRTCEETQSWYEITVWVWPA